MVEMLTSVFTITLRAPFVLALSTSDMMASFSLFYGSWAPWAEFDLDDPILVDLSYQSPQFSLILALHIPMMLPPAFLAYPCLAFRAGCFRLALWAWFCCFISVLFGAEYLLALLVGTFEEWRVFINSILDKEPIEFLQNALLIWGEDVLKVFSFKLLRAKRLWAVQILNVIIALYFKGILLLEALQAEHVPAPPYLVPIIHWLVANVALGLFHLMWPNQLDSLNAKVFFFALGLFMCIIMHHSYLMLLFSLSARLTPLVMSVTYVWVK